MEGEGVGFADSDLVPGFFSKISDGGTARRQRNERDQGNRKDAIHNHH